MTLISVSIIFGEGSIMEDKYSFVADNLHGSIMISSFEKDIMVTTLFNRLHGVYQNSTAYLTFPANRTRRLEHSFGCMYLCGKIFYSSICNCDSKDEGILTDFFNRAEKEITVILDELNDAYGNKYESKLGYLRKKFLKQYKELTIFGGLYHYYIPANIHDEQKRKLYCLLFEAVRVAAMLHDIGHPPFSHISENALNILYKQTFERDDKNKKEQDFLNALDGMVGSHHQLHEELGIKIAELLLREAIPDISEEEARKPAIYQNQVYKLVVSEIAMRILTEKTLFFKQLHSIIDGTLDGDRLDYVSRDPMNSGLKLGITEYDRLIGKMKLCEKDERFSFCPNVSVVKTTEDFLLRRWNLYKNVIYHHRVAKTDYLLQNVIVRITEDYFKDTEESESENESYILPYDISGLWKANQWNNSSDKEKIYVVSQWDDTWLLTILKKMYFEKYIEEDSYLHDQLEELLTNKKNYFSLIKRKEEFEEIDAEVASVLYERKDELKEIIKNLNVQGENKNEKQKDDKEEKLFDIAGYLQSIEETIDLAETNEKSSFAERGFILYAIKKKILGENEELFCDLLRKASVEIGTGKDDEVLITVKKFKTGTNKSLHFYQRNNGEENLIELDKISNISNVLQEDLKFVPFFYVYVNRKTEGTDTAFLRKKLGRSLGGCIVEYILTTLGKFIEA